MTYGSCLCIQQYQIILQLRQFVYPIPCIFISVFVYPLGSDDFHSQKRFMSDV